MLLGLALAATPALAQGRGNGKGNDKAKDRDDRIERRDHDRDHDRLRGHDRDGHDRDDRVVGRHHDGRPPGWSKGKKVGWGNCDVPPGQAKKVGCRHHTRRVVVRRPQPPIVRSPRPRVEAHGSVHAEVH